MGVAVLDLVGLLRIPVTPPSRMPTVPCPAVQPTVVFPAILDLLELHAFDLCKIIDPFVRYEPTMPRDIRRHLFSIEERILESMAWAQGSTLYPLLIMACGGSTPATSRVDGVPGRDSAGEHHAIAWQLVLSTGDHAPAYAGHGLWGQHTSHQQGGCVQGRDCASEQHVLLRLQVVGTGVPARAPAHHGWRWQHASHQQG